MKQWSTRGSGLLKAFCLENKIRCENLACDNPNGWYNFDGLKLNFSEYTTLPQYQELSLKDLLELYTKKVTGYKLIKKYPSVENLSLGHIEPYTTGLYGKYPEFWEPEYEEIFNVGDWVTVIETPNDNHWILRTNDRTFKLNGINEFFGCSYNNNTSAATYGLTRCKFRKATLEEIENTKKTIVTLSNGQMVNVTKDTIIAAGEEIDPAKIQLLINPVINDYLNDWSVKVEDITYKIGCWKGITKADIILILKTQKELP